MKEFLVFLFSCCGLCQDNLRDDIAQRMQDPVFNTRNSSFQSDDSSLVDFFLDLDDVGVTYQTLPVRQDKSVQTDSYQIEYPEVKENLLKILQERSFPVPFEIKMQLVASLNSNVDNQEMRKEFWKKFSIEHNVPEASATAIFRLLLYNCDKPTFSVKHCGSPRKKSDLVDQGGGSRKKRDQQVDPGDNEW